MDKPTILRSLQKTFIRLFLSVALLLNSHLGLAGANKVSICHRMGGAEVSIEVDDDGFYNGHINHPLDTLGECAESDSSEPDPDSGIVADSGEPDYFIPSCNSEPEEREELCDQIFETVDSSYYDDSSDFSKDSTVLNTICSTYDFSSKKMVICHKNKVTLHIANQGACNGHFPNHEDDYYGPCIDDSGHVEVNEDNIACVTDSSSLFLSGDVVAADSGLEHAIDECDDNIPVDPNTGDAMSGRPGRFNWREFFQ